MKDYFVYMITNWTGKVLYTGKTNNLERQMLEHKQNTIDGFSKKYNLTNLVYYETCSTVDDAIRREKQLKNWSRMKKNKLVEGINSSWKDLSEGWYDDPSAALGMTGGRRG